MPTAERGFSLLEVMVCAAVFALASAAAAGALAAVVRGAGAPLARDAALMVAENALVRARAALAYVSTTGGDASLLLADRGWGLPAGANAFEAGVELRGRGLCARTEPLLIRLPVSTRFEPATQRFTVSVTYPRDPCAVGSDGTLPSNDVASVSLSQTMPPSAYPPGAVLLRDIMTPARM